MSTYAEQLAAIAELSGVDPAKIKGYALVVDDGSPQATVITDLPLPDCRSLLYGVTEIAVAGAPREDGPARISEAAVDNAMAAQLGWCPAATGPDEELDRELHCDKQLGEDGKHAGNHHAHVGDGSEVAWGDENDPWIRNGTRFGAAGQDGA